MPTAIETGARPSKQRPTDSARALVREVVGAKAYDRAWMDRLGVAVDKLTRAGRDGDVIREALREWEARSDVRTPEGLASVANDVAKRARGRPTVRPSTTDQRVADAQSLKRPEWDQPLTQPDRKAISS